jgi:branched-chain amino acid transport system substrate-binding protein
VNEFAAATENPFKHQDAISTASGLLGLAVLTVGIGGRAMKGGKAMLIERKPGVLLLIAAILLAGCGPATPSFECTDAIGCVAIPPGQTVKIGVIHNLSGAGPPGLFMLHSAELALEDRGGRLLGHPGEAVSADGKCSGEGGTTAALKITADPQILGIVGPTCSGEAVTAMKVVSEAGLVMISGSCTAPSLTSVGGRRGSDWQPGFLRTAQNDALGG